MRHDAELPDLVVATRQATVRYGRTPAVENVTLAVPRGVMGALVGPNGAASVTFSTAGVRP